MRQLSTIQNNIFLAGAIMMVVGAGCMVFRLIPTVTSVIFALGTIFFALMQMTQTYSGNSLTIRRLRSLMVLGDIFFILAGLLAVETFYGIVRPFFETNINSLTIYAKYIFNNWVVALLIAAIFEMYTTHRISHELKKEMPVEEEEEEESENNNQLEEK